MKFPLGTSAGTVHSAPLLLIDLETEEGITGRTYLFCYRRSVPRAIDVVLQDAVSVLASSTKTFALWAGKKPFAGTGVRHLS
jgi:mandelate racemase